MRLLSDYFDHLRRLPFIFNQISANVELIKGDNDDDTKHSGSFGNQVRKKLLSCQ